LIVTIEKPILTKRCGGLSVQEILWQDLVVWWQGLGYPNYEMSHFSYQIPGGCNGGNGSESQSSKMLSQNQHIDTAERERNGGKDDAGSRGKEYHQGIAEGGPTERIVDYTMFEGPTQAGVEERLSIVVETRMSCSLHRVVGLLLHCVGLLPPPKI
jgi:hypothetical protein